MKLLLAISLACLSFGILATDDPATGYYLGKKPVDGWIATVSSEHNSDIQAAECAHNTRMSNQMFAWFQIDPKKIEQNGSTYGTCYATTQVPKDTDLEDDSGFDVFYWQNSGGKPGVGTGPIRDPNTGEPGYEDNSGVFHKGADPNGGSGSGSGDTTGPTSGRNNTSIASHGKKPNHRSGKKGKAHHKGGENNDEDVHPKPHGKSGNSHHKGGKKSDEVKDPNPHGKSGNSQHKGGKQSDEGTHKGGKESDEGTDPNPHGNSGNSHHQGVEKNDEGTDPNPHGIKNRKRTFLGW